MSDLFGSHRGATYLFSPTRYWEKNPWKDVKNEFVEVTAPIFSYKLQRRTCGILDSCGLFICTGRQLVLIVRLRELARHLKTDRKETVALWFGYTKTPCLRAGDMLSSRADEQAIGHLNTWALGSWAHSLYPVHLLVIPMYICT
jgi:hypothetical protein